MQVRKKHLQLDMEQQTGSQFGKEYIEAVYCHPVYLTYVHAEYIMWNAGQNETQLGIKIAGSNINNLRYTEDTNLMTKRRGTRECLDEGESGEWESWLKTQHSKK